MQTCCTKFVPKFIVHNNNCRIPRLIYGTLSFHRFQENPPQGKNWLYTYGYCLFRFLNCPADGSMDESSCQNPAAGVNKNAVHDV